MARQPQYTGSQIMAALAKRSPAEQAAAIRNALNRATPAERDRMIAVALANQQHPDNGTPPADTPPDVMRPRGKRRDDYVEDFTVYELDFLALVAGTTSTQSIPIQADSAFKWTKATAYATIANAAFTENARPVPSVLVSIQDTGSGRQLFNSPVPVSNIFGIGQLPFILPVERVFQARSAIQVTVTNFDAAVTYNLRLSFIGAKIFNYNNP